MIIIYNFLFELRYRINFLYNSWLRLIKLLQNNHLNNHILK